MRMLSWRCCFCCESSRKAVTVNPAIPKTRRKPDMQIRFLHRWAQGFVATPATVGFWKQSMMSVQHHGNVISDSVQCTAGE